MTKICPICGREFEPEKPQCKYCDDICRDIAIKMRYNSVYKRKEFEPRKCEYCGKEFTPICKNQIYCSHKCKCKMLAHKMSLRRSLKRKNSL